MMDKRPIIIDCDTGIDDAVALTIACISEEIDILAVTTVAGNCTVDNSTRNTCNVLHFLGRDDIPVGKGAAEPKERPLITAGSVHGTTGLRGWKFEEDYSDNLSSKDAVELLYEVLIKSQEPVTIVALGPVTNIEKLIRVHSDIKYKIREIVFMGMSYHSGNPTALSTFNVLVDPEAFRSLLFSGIPIIACPLDTTRKTYLSPDDRKRICSVGTKASVFVSSILSGYGELLPNKNLESELDFVSSGDMLNDENLPMHDPATIAYVIKPSLFNGTKYYADVECKGEITMGFTFIDKENYYKKTEEEKNVFILETVDRQGFVDLFIERLGEYQ